MKVESSPRAIIVGYSDPLLEVLVCPFLYGASICCGIGRRAKIQCFHGMTVYALASDTLTLKLTKVCVLQIAANNNILLKK